MLLIGSLRPRTLRIPLVRTVNAFKHVARMRGTQQRRRHCADAPRHARAMGGGKRRGASRISISTPVTSDSMLRLLESLAHSAPLSPPSRGAPSPADLSVKAPVAAEMSYSPWRLRRHPLSSQLQPLKSTKAAKMALKCVSSLGGMVWNALELLEGLKLTYTPLYTLLCRSVSASATQRAGETSVMCAVSGCLTRSARSDP
jgi:hypothetical protein